MLGFPGEIVNAMMHGPENQAAAAVSIAGLSPVDGSIIIQERALQFWPESLSEEPEIGWSFKEIPGSSHALAQWTQNGGRTFSFEVQMSRFMRPWEDFSPMEKFQSLGLNKPDAEIPLNNRPMNISVKEQIQWLRQFYLPDYVQQDVSGVQGIMVSQPPPIAMLCFPKTGLNEDGSDVIWAVMTQCSINYTLWFPNGEPRLASANLGFRQVIQHPLQGIKLKARSMYGNITDYERNIDYGGGRRIDMRKETMP